MKTLSLNEQQAGYLHQHGELLWVVPVELRWSTDAVSLGAANIDNDTRAHVWAHDNGNPYKVIAPHQPGDVVWFNNELCPQSHEAVPRAVDPGAAIERATVTAVRAARLHDLTDDERRRAGDPVALVLGGNPVVWLITLELNQ